MVKPDLWPRFTCSRSLPHTGHWLSGGIGFDPWPDIPSSFPLHHHHTYRFITSFAVHRYFGLCDYDIPHHNNLPSVWKAFDQQSGRCNSFTPTTARRDTLFPLAIRFRLLLRLAYVVTLCACHSVLQTSRGCQDTPTPGQNRKKGVSYLPHTRNYTTLHARVSIFPIEEWRLREIKLAPIGYLALAEDTL